MSAFILRWALLTSLGLTLIGGIPPSLTLSESQAQTRSTSTRFAILIGANLGFRDEVPLRFAERDALHMSRTLARFGQVPATQQLVLLSPELNDIEQGFQTLNARIKALPPSSSATLIFYYSGHADANAFHIGPQRLTLDALKNLLAHIPTSLKLIFIDACRSGGFTRLKGARKAAPFKIRTTPLAIKGVAVISSSSSHEDSQESDVTRGGIFTQHLITGLMGAADRSKDLKVSLTELYEYTYRETVKSTSETMSVQHPNYAFSLRGKDEVILTQLDQRRGFARVTLTTPEPQGGVYLFIPQVSDLPLNEIHLSSPQQILLHPGQYLVRYRDLSGLYERVYSLRAETQHHVKRSDLKQIPYGVSVRRGRSFPSSVNRGLGVWSLSLEMDHLSASQAQMSNRWGGGALLERHTPSFSLQLRLIASLSAPLTESIGRFEQIEGGLEIGGGRFWDWGGTSLTAQLRMGMIGVSQRFYEDSNAHSRLSWVGLISPLFGIQQAIGARIFTRVSGGPRVWLLPQSEQIEEGQVNVKLGWGITLTLGAYL